MEKLDKVIAALRCCREKEDDPCEGNCPYAGQPDCVGIVMAEALEVLRNTEPVVHARWIVPDDNYPDTCSNCLFEFVWDGDDDYHPKRCPHCGAHMDEEVTYE